MICASPWMMVTSPATGSAVDRDGRAVGQSVRNAIAVLLRRPPLLETSRREPLWHSRSVAGGVGRGRRNEVARRDEDRQRDVEGDERSRRSATLTSRARSRLQAVLRLGRQPVVAEELELLNVDEGRCASSGCVPAPCWPTQSTEDISGKFWKACFGAAVGVAERSRSTPRIHGRPRGGCRRSCRRHVTAGRSSRCCECCRSR